jgi:retron-type reverse transcriptase
MKRANNLLPLIADIDNLRLAFWKASKGKRHSEEVLRYQANIDKNLLSLQQEILIGKVQVGKYRYFKIYEPKERQICASAFSEQVLHHALMNICHQHFEKIQIFDSYASRKGKGIHKAVARVQHFARHNGYFLKLDVRKFFDSIHHEVLKEQLARVFKEKILLSIFFQIIDSYQASENRGVPIGNLTSQYFANHYLASLDHFIKENLNCKAYVRYMDDMLFLDPDKPSLKVIFARVEQFIAENLQCTLKPETLRAVHLGIPFLGYLSFPTHIRLLQPSKKRFFRKFSKIQNEYDTLQKNEQYCQRRALPLLAFVRKARTKSMREKCV